MADLEALTVASTRDLPVHPQQDPGPRLRPDGPGDRQRVRDQEPQRGDVPPQGPPEEGPDPPRAEHVAGDPAPRRPDQRPARRPAIKLIGRIAAGSPIEAIEQADEELAFTEWEGADDKFALQVTGESMIEEHIADGDYVIIQKQEQARDGQIVAVRDDDGRGHAQAVLQGEEPVPPRAGQQDHEADLPRQGRHHRRPGRRRPEVLSRTARFG